MRAAVFVDEGICEIQDRPLPKITQPDEVRLAVEVCGLCGTDLHILATPPGHPATPGTILGHEFLGHIVEVGSQVSAFDVGQRVVVDPNLKCGVCRFCRRGLGNHCENWTTLGIFCDGGFASHVVVPQRALHPIAESVPWQDAVWTEILSCVSASTDQLPIKPGQTAVVIGAGPVGVLHGKMLQSAGAQVILCDREPFRLECAQRIGLDRTINVAEEPLVSTVESWTDGEFADAVVDAVGNQFDNCLDIVQVGGVIALFGMNTHATPAVRQSEITRKEVTVIGSYVGRHAFPRAVMLLEKKIIQPSALITHEIDVEQFRDGLDAARSGKAMKVVVTPGSA